MKTTRMEVSVLSQEEDMSYWSWVQDFRIDCNISSVMNPYCKVATSIGIMPLHLIINNEGCCVAHLFVFFLFHILEDFVLTPSLAHNCQNLTNFSFSMIILANFSVNRNFKCQEPQF